MSTNTDKQTTGRTSNRFLTTLREVLFEPTAERPPEPHSPVLSSTSHDEEAIEQARTALVESLHADLGPAAREFALQVEALEDALPDAALRRRAALRVLSLKGVTREALALEFDRILTALSAHGETFASKVASRTAALEQRRDKANAECRREIAEAEQNIAHLEAALAAERKKIGQAGEQRERLLAECDADAAELAAKQRGFERAFSELHHKYATSKQELVSAESS